MKQKKKPIMLIVTGACVVGVLAVVNGAKLLDRSQPPIEAPSTEQPELPKPKQVSSADKIASRNQLRQAMMTGNKNITGEGPETALTNPTRPTILLPEFKRVDPIVNDSTTSSQWYQEDHRQQKLKDELNKKKKS